MTAGCRCPCRAGCWPARAADCASRCARSDRAAGGSACWLAKSGWRSQPSTNASTPSRSIARPAPRRWRRGVALGRVGQARRCALQHQRVTRSGAAQRQVQRHATAHRVAEHGRPLAVAARSSTAHEIRRRSAPCGSAPGSAGRIGRPWPIRSTAMVRRPRAANTARIAGPSRALPVKPCSSSSGRPVDPATSTCSPIAADRASQPSIPLEPLPAPVDTACHSSRCSATLRSRSVRTSTTCRPPRRGSPARRSAKLCQLFDAVNAHRTSPRSG